MRWDVGAHHEGAGGEGGVGRHTDKTAKKLIWLLRDTPFLKSAFNLEESTQSVGHIHRISKLGSSVDDDGERLGDDDDLTASAEVEMRVDYGPRWEN